MSVNAVESGITLQHIQDIQRTCKEVNTFLFVRPSTQETMSLIGEGYATKSMDIHDKSSDWGPMSGFVPCDQAFSKALTGTPNANPQYVKHGEAEPVVLTLTDRLAEPGAKFESVKNEPRFVPMANVRFVRCKGDGTKRTTFKLEKKQGAWEVSWMNEQRAIPLYVWGYDTGEGVKPVTGDYDLWMVAPHISRWNQHTKVMGIKDSHGESGATQFITWLLKKLNDECQRTNNHVFHHGAEAQNYGFTQAIDKKLAMFTPMGTSRMVDREDDLPAILGDVQNAGYLVYWNKRYEESDPQLMGRAVNAGVSGAGGDKISNLVAEANQVKAAPAPKITKGPLAGVTFDGKAKDLVQKNLLGRGGEVPKIQQIQAFNKALQEAMNGAQRDGSAPKKLKLGEDVSQDVWASKGDAEGLRLQQQLQRAMVELSQMDYGSKADEHGVVKPTAGAALSPDPKKWEAWAVKNQDLFNKLEQHFGRAAPLPMLFEKSGKRAYNAVDSERLLGPFAALFSKMFPS